MEKTTAQIINEHIEETLAKLPENLSRKKLALYFYCKGISDAVHIDKVMEGK